MHACQGGQSTGQVLGCLFLKHSGSGLLCSQGDRGREQVAIISRDRGLRANRVMKGHLVFLKDILQETSKCPEADTQEPSATQQSKLGSYNMVLVNCSSRTHTEIFSPQSSLIIKTLSSKLYS